MNAKHHYTDILWPQKFPDGTTIRRYVQLILKMRYYFTFSKNDEMEVSPYLKSGN